MVRETLESIVFIIVCIEVVLILTILAPGGHP